MTKQEARLASAVFSAIKEKAENLNFVDRMVLLNAFKNDSQFLELPNAQRQLFLDVGMAVVRALQQGSRDATG